MKNIVLATLAILCAASACALTGSGTEQDPYLITSFEDFDEFAQNPDYYNDHIRLETNIDLSNRTYTTAVIAGDPNCGGFSGSFDGNNKVISNLNIDTGGAGRDSLGLFGRIRGHAEVKNLRIENAVITGGRDSDYLGALCGWCSSQPSDPNSHVISIISNCSVTAFVSGGRWLGALCGYNDHGSITDCSVTGTVSGDRYLGGLCGYNEYGMISNCYTTASVSGIYILGGLCGYSEYGTISNCYATSSVSGNYSLGGLCGRNDRGTISNCCGIASVSGHSNLGALCGYNDCGAISNCYAVGQIDGTAGSHYFFGGLCGQNGGTIRDCYATVHVTAPTSKYLGGLCGHNYGTIHNCYATGHVTGHATGDADSKYLGGLCGYNDGTICNCYATGDVAAETNSDYLGGLCGYNRGTLSNCYAIGALSGRAHLGALCGWNLGTIDHSYFCLFTAPDNNVGTALEAEQMIQSGSFAGFDFAGSSADGTQDHWAITPGHCPKLSWQEDDGPLLASGLDTTLPGSGTPDDPFQINSTADFTEFIANDRLSFGHYVLACDIDLSGRTFATAVVNRCFGGHLEGGSHTIANVSIDTLGVSTDYLGLIARISGSISNLRIENLTIIGGMDSDYLGALCGQNSSGTISGCHATGQITGGTRSHYVGGLCGYNVGTIANCQAAGSVSGYRDLGGLCGLNDGGTISGCCAAVHVTGGDSSYYLGGLCGRNSYSGGTIRNSCATGSVSGVAYLGGLCGFNQSGTIDLCSATGSVDHGTWVGGLCGANDGRISNCYATGSVSGHSSVGGLCGWNWRGWIRYCCASGQVTGTATDSYCLGGLCGENSGWISNCYVTGSVSGHEFVGGLCGLNYLKGGIDGSYATGRITGNSSVGGFCGRNYQSVTDSFWDKQASGLTTSDGGTPKTTPEMKTLSTFTTAGWDFVLETTNGQLDHWYMPAGDYPKLWWQNPLPHDTDFSGAVDIPDLQKLADEYLLKAADLPNYRLKTDHNTDGLVDLLDFAAFANKW